MEIPFVSFLFVVDYFIELAFFSFLASTSTAQHSRETIPTPPYTAAAEVPAAAAPHVSLLRTLVCFVSYMCLLSNNIPPPYADTKL